MKRYTLLLFVAAFVSAIAMARPALRRPSTVTQPDGTTITLLMHGDEFRHYTTTADGYTVVRGADGFWRYANLTDGLLVASDMVARDAADRSAENQSFLAGRQRHMRPAMTTAQQLLRQQREVLMSHPLAAQLAPTAPIAAKGGTKRAVGRIDYAQFKGLVLLVEFSDRQFLRSDAKAFYSQLINTTDLKGYYDVSGENYTKTDGSARDYFRQNSLGIFDPQFDVVGPIQIDMKSTDVKGNDNAVAAITAAVKAADSQVDYSQYDLDRDGYIDMVYLLFAGYGSYMPGNNQDYLWPHATDLRGYINTRYDNKRLSRYACSVEIQDLEEYADQRQTLDGIGTICHEFSHVLGLADHYDTDYEENGEAPHPDMWDVMANGADYNNGLTPCGYNAYERYSLGFVARRDLDVAGDYSLQPFNTSNEFYYLKTGTDREVFYLENRQQTGWDRYLPGSGLLVWRCDSTNSTVWTRNRPNANPNHMYFELMSACPTKAVSSAFTPFPGKAGVVDFTATSSPALLNWRGLEAKLDLYDITETDGVISFTAGKNIYESGTEDFESFDVTTDDASGLNGPVFSWTLSKAIIANATNEGYGNGNRVLRLGRSGTASTTPLQRDLRHLSFTVWTAGAQVRVGLRAKTGDGSWAYLKNSDDATSVTLKKNTETIFSYSTAIPAGTELQLQMLATTTSAVAYVDDIMVSYADKTADGIVTVNADSEAATAAYNLAGQRVAPSHRGLQIVGGKKVVK